MQSNWINIKTEYSFKSTYGKISTIVAKLKKDGATAAGIADINNTFGHVAWNKTCKLAGIKPIFGVRLTVVNEIIRDKTERRSNRDLMTFVALTESGLRTIYHLVDLAHRQFYFVPLLDARQVNDLDRSHVLTIVNSHLLERIDHRKVYISLDPSTPDKVKAHDLKKFIACPDNWFPGKDDKPVYESFADPRLMERKTSLMHIPTDKEWQNTVPGQTETALINRNHMADLATVKLPSAPMIKHTEGEDYNFHSVCSEKLREMGLNKKKYLRRLESELAIIKEKKFESYFVVVADLINFAKKKGIMVGPGRGSSAGSLVCFVLGITDIDPLVYGLSFHRFIDINRLDFPDIDIDFQDTKREMVYGYLTSKYGSQNVAKVGSISTLKPRSAIDRVARNLNIDLYLLEKLKDGIEENSIGDKSLQLGKLFKTDEGKAYFENIPQLKYAKMIEGHASHSGVHAGGVIVCNETITKYCGINSREAKFNIAMIDKDTAVDLNLLKIDVLGLTTLSVLADCLDSIGQKPDYLASINLKDKKVYKTFKNSLFAGIFQFEGDSVKDIMKTCPVESINDISAVVALCRPGPLKSGSTKNYIDCRLGRKKVINVIDDKTISAITKKTYGVIVYQEQVISICREYAGLSWKKVGEIRKAISKSKGDDFFKGYRKKFIKSAVKNGSNKADAKKVWNEIRHHGGYSFNKSHSISYSVISYFCAYLKTYYPLDFAVAVLNNTKDDKTAIRILRELDKRENIRHFPATAVISERKWSVFDGMLVQGLESIDGIGPKTAASVVSKRKKGLPLTAAVRAKIEQGDSPFREIYPAEKVYSKKLKRKLRKKWSPVADIWPVDDGKTVVVIGEVTKIFRGVESQPQKNFDTVYIEDDTGTISGRTFGNAFDRYSNLVANKIKVGKTWIRITGTYKHEYNSITIDEMEIL